VLATSAVLIANLGICISDFVGAGAALGLAGIPSQVSVPLLAVGIWLVIVRGSYRSAERIFIWFTIPFFAYPIAAILGNPHWGDVGKALVVPQLHTGSTYLLLLIATVGTTITPYMQLYLQSAVVERGVRDEDLGREEAEAVSGAVFACVISAFIVIATGATLYTHGIHEVGSAADAAHALTPFAGQFAEALFGIGLLGASLLAAAILPIATSYVVSESLGYEKGIGRGREEAPVFVGIITAMIAVSAIVAVVPGVPVISLLVAVQVVNGVLLPINLFFIWRLARSRQLMGERRSRGLLDGAAGVTVVVLSCLSIVLVVVTVAGL
jgi:Mn2+/Fe2+ NRAMP family transporter